MEPDNITKALDILTDVQSCIYDELQKSDHKSEKAYMNFILDEVSELKNIIEESRNHDWEEEDEDDD